MLLQPKATVSVSGLAMTGPMILVLILSGLMTMGLAGCSSSSTPSTQTAQAKASAAPPAWQVTTEGGAEATLIVSPEGVMKVDIAELGEEGKKWHVRLTGPQSPVKTGDRYTVAFRARAAAPRKMIVRTQQTQESSAPLHLFERVSLTEQWQSFRFDFEPKFDDETARLVFNLGESDEAVEIADVTLGPQTASPATQEAEGVDGGTTAP